MSIQAIGAVHAAKSMMKVNEEDDKANAINIPQTTAELRQLQDSQLISQAVTKAMDIKDVDRDGKLSQKELGFSDRIFRALDTDKSGFIEDGELRAKCNETKEMIRTVADVMGQIQGGPSLDSLKSLMNKKQF